VKPPEFNVNARIKIEFGRLEYWVDVNEYGDATIKCFEGRGEIWSARVRPGKTLREVGRESIVRHALDDAWITRLDNALADCRVLVDAGHVPKPYEPPCTCPATSEYDDHCPRHGVVGIGVTPR